MASRKKNEDEGPSREDLIKGLPNNLGSISGPAEEHADPEEVSVQFDNSDLEQGGELTKEEFITLTRLFMALGGEEAQSLPVDTVRELAMEAILALTDIFRDLYEMREKISVFNGDTSGLTSSMLSVIGETGRLRSLIPKLQANS